MLEAALEAAFTRPVQIIAASHQHVHTLVDMLKSDRFKTKYAEVYHNVVVTSLKPNMPLRVVDADVFYDHFTLESNTASRSILKEYMRYNKDV